MSPRSRLPAAVLVLLALTGALLEESFLHTDDGCVIETHCNACLLQLRTPGVVAVVFSLPRVVVPVDTVAPAPPPARHTAAPRTLSSRGPPPA